MKPVLLSFTVIAGLFATAGQAWADNLAGATVLLCAPVHVTRCYARGECESGTPWKWETPAFVEIDLKAKVIRTTSANPKAQQTAITSVQREGGQIHLQGLENGRLFSYVIVEEGGLASMALVLDGITISTFGSCTVRK